jgi:MFS family permease
LITAHLVFVLGLSQLVCWGISYYLVGVFGQAMAAELGWSLTGVHAGYSLSLVTMGLCSARVGRLIDQRGGAFVMSIGSLLLAAGCGLLAISGPGLLFWFSWLVLGVAMRCTLYDAAFAALARIAGPRARRPIAQITLLGGLASTVFWPLGHALAERFGWRGAVALYAVIGLATLLLHRRIPDARWRAATGHVPVEPLEPIEPVEPVAPVIEGGVAASARRTPPAAAPQALDANAWLFAAICALVSFTNAAMSSQMIVLLTGLGFGAVTAVWVSSLRGVAQTGARLAEILFGRRLAPLDLNLAAATICLGGFAIGPVAGWSLWAAVAFAVLFGAGNGLLTITRGTVPLQLFAPEHYGTIVGRLVAPGFYLAASAPVIVAWIIENHGARRAALLLLALAAGLVAVSVILRRRTLAVRQSSTCPPR